MSLTETNMLETVKKQYLFKLKAYIGAFSSLFAAQVVALLFSLGGVGSMGTGSATFYLSIKYYSADMVIVFTMIWSFIIGILITTRHYRFGDFIFVTNRLSSNLANLVFLLTACLAGGITAMLSGFLLKTGIYLWYNQQGNFTFFTIISVPELLTGLLATMLYMLLFGALGYFIGMICQLYRLFVVLVPALFFGMFLLGVNPMISTPIEALVESIFQESSLLLFVLKVMLAASLLFASSFLISNRLEVRT